MFLGSPSGMAPLYVKPLRMSRTPFALFSSSCEAASHLHKNAVVNSLPVNEIRDYLAKIGRKGGKTRVQNQTPEQRIQSARKAAQARWAKNEQRITAALKEIAEGTKVLLKKSRSNSRKAKEKKNKAKA